MIVQAKNSNGEWADIEYLPSSWCGNSIHTLTLAPHEKWDFTTPVYHGINNTKLRIALYYIDQSFEAEYPWNRKELVVYSNEYNGSINPAQFWRKRDYRPSGLMDPYMD